MIEFVSVPITLDASAGEESPRSVTGVAVPWDTPAQVSSGERVLFRRGAFDVNAKAPKLLEGHDMTQLRGVVTELVEADEGLLFTAKFAKTRAADEAIELIKAGAYDSVSVGAVPVKYKFDKSGTMVVSKANLVEISLVAQPAFADAVITEIAASQPEEEDAVETQPNDIPEEETMSQETPAVEASAEIVPTAPIVFAQARREVPMPTATEYLAAAISGGDQWRAMSEVVRAAAPDIVTNDTPGILPTPIVAPVYNNFIGRRPVVDAVGVKAMPGGGKVFIRPEVTTHTTIGASIGEQSPSQGTLVVFNNQVTKQIFGGYVNISEADIDWTDPAILQVVLDDMGRIYANATDNYAADQLVAGATTTKAFADFGTTADPAAWVAAAYYAASTILSASNGNLPNHMFVAPDVFQLLGQLSDTADRPLFPQVGPMNAFGTMTAGSVDATAFGLKVVVDRNFAAGTLIIGDGSGYELFEQQKGAISIDSPSTLSRTIAFRGYFAALMIDPTKFVKFT